VAWLAWAGRSGSSDGRTVAFHLFDAAYVAQAPRPLARWVIPWPGPPAGPVLALLLVGAAVVLVRRRRVEVLEAPPGPLGALPVLLGAFAAAYLAVLVANRVLVDATGRLDARFLLPLHVVAIVAVVPFGYRLRARRGVAIAAGALLVAQVVGGLAWTAGGLSDAGVRRRGYAARAWRESAIVARLRSGDRDAALYTNGFDALFLLTGWAGRPIPALRDYLTDRPNPRYDEQLAAMRGDLERTGGVLVYFDAVTARRSFLPSKVELERALPLEVVATDPVGTMYRLRPGAAQPPRSSSATR